MFLVNWTTTSTRGSSPTTARRARGAGRTRGKRFLNLFAYTGSFTCAAGKGGALRTTSVDASQAFSIGLSILSS